MRVSTTLNKKASAVRGSIDAISAARSFGTMSRELHNRLREVVTNMGTAPQWAREYIRGYQDCLTGSLYLTDLVYGGYIDGVFCSTLKSRADYYERRDIGAKTWNDTATEKGHYWEETKTRGLKPFFISGD